MQLNQPVQNPAFISKLKQFDSNKTRKDELELIEEMRKMRYITPVTLTGKSEDGTPNQQTQVKFRAATTTKGELFAMFSDMDELKKWAADAEDTMTLDFSGIAHAGTWPERPGGGFCSQSIDAELGDPHQHHGADRPSASAASDQPRHGCAVQARSISDRTGKGALRFL